MRGERLEVKLGDDGTVAMQIPPLSDNGMQLTQEAKRGMANLDRGCSTWMQQRMCLLDDPPTPYPKAGAQLLERPFEIKEIDHGRHHGPGARLAQTGHGNRQRASFERLEPWARERAKVDFKERCTIFAVAQIVPQRLEQSRQQRGS